MSDEREKGASAMGFFVGALVGLALCVPAGWLVVGRLSHQAVEGWELKPVVVANEDLAAGSVVTYEVISQRPIPEQSLGPSMIEPADASHIVGQPLTAPARVGEVLTWQHFGRAPRR